MLSFVLWDKPPAPVDRVAWSPETQWIGSQEPSYSFYARRTFDLAENAQAGWLKLSADNDFVLYVNGKDIAKEVSTVNNSLGFASKLSEKFQNVNDSVNYRSNGGAFYALSNTRDWKLTTYIDLTNYVRPGKNTIALAIQKNRQNPRVVVEGAVYPTRGSDPIDLSTGATPWKISTLAENHHGLRWFDPEFRSELGRSESDLTCSSPYLQSAESSFVRSLSSGKLDHWNGESARRGVAERQLADSPSAAACLCKGVGRW